ncbi:MULTISPECIES: hypothetical protein [Aeromonas]|uniref:hypothetical protein n=1 Tax=Aeromonas TaxID=642 RepID=UPI002B057A19|nr:hypothetical protein [Aeromonas jandaei]
MSDDDKKWLVITDEIQVGPVLAVLLLIYILVSGNITWWLALLVVFLWSFHGNVVINWRKLFRRR